MPLFQAVILAIVQGVTEFLPVSSSGHLALAPWLLGWTDQGLTFDIALHFGTLAAVLLYFFRDWLQILAQGFGIDWGADPALKHNPRLLWWLAAATVPTGIAGILLGHHAEEIRSPLVIGSMLIGIGLLMGYAEKVSQRRKKVDGMTFTDAMIVGLAQPLALIPGTSRSGITITAALFRDVDRYAAARFSFLLSTPAIGAAAVKAFLDLHKQGGIPADMRMPFLVGVVVSGITGCLVIRYFLHYLRDHSLRVFVYYRVIFGIIVIALSIFLRRSAG